MQPASQLIMIIAGLVRLEACLENDIILENKEHFQKPSFVAFQLISYSVCPLTSRLRREGLLRPKQRSVTGKLQQFPFLSPLLP